MKRALGWLWWLGCPLIWAIYAIAMIVPTVGLLLVVAGMLVAEGPGAWRGHGRAYTEMWTELGDFVAPDRIDPIETED